MLSQPLSVHHPARCQTLDRKSKWSELKSGSGLRFCDSHTSDYHFFQQPQAWLIPIALSVLIAAQLNREGFTEPDDRDPLLVAGGDLRLFNGRHFHQRRGPVSLAPANSRGAVDCRSLLRNHVSHPRISFVGFDLFVAGDHHDDLLRRGELWLDVAVVCRGNYHRRANHRHLRGV